ncbi:MAG TPA: hypothetical protein VFK86_18030 [Bauldia sp.]|nr:hypothetical protein [Bauldia sp.]
MRKAILGATLMAAMATSGAVGLSQSAVAKDNTGAVIGGLVAGAVIGAAVASSVNHPSKIYVNPAPPPPPRPNPWANAFSPSPGVTCYPVQRACYKANGAYAANMTAKIFR